MNLDQILLGSGLIGIIILQQISNLVGKFRSKENDLTEEILEARVQNIELTLRQKFQNEYINKMGTALQIACPTNADAISKITGAPLLLAAGVHQETTTTTPPVSEETEESEELETEANPDWGRLDTLTNGQFKVSGGWKFTGGTITRLDSDGEAAITQDPFIPNICPVCNKKVGKEPSSLYGHMRGKTKDSRHKEFYETHKGQPAKAGLHKKDVISLIRQIDSDGEFSTVTYKYQ